MATATKDWTEAELAQRAERLAAKEAEAKKTDKHGGIIDNILADIEAYVDKLDERDREKARNLVAPKDATKETVIAAWNAATDVTNSYTKARGLLGTNKAEADRIVNEAVAHFTALRLTQPDVYAGAMLVLHIQAEESMAKAAN
nr:Unknown Function [uncultured bacterium]